MSLVYPAQAGYGLVVATTTGQVLTELIPLALVIALSPLSIIPAVLVLHTPRPKPTGLAFLLGWVTALAALTVLFTGISGLIGGFDHPPRWASFVRIVIGVALIVFGVIRWIKRNAAAHTPGWMRSITEATPTKAAVTAAVLTVANPKVLFICLAAGLAVGTSGLGVPGTWLAAAIFVVASASSVIVPVLAYVIAGSKLDPTLTRIKEWLERHHAALVAIILIVIGLMVLYKGIHGL